MKIKTLFWSLLLCAFSLEARFTSVDPAREHFNPYKYAGNNPIVTIDLDGNADVIVNDSYQKSILEAAIESLPGPLGKSLRDHDFIVTLLPSTYYERVLGITTFNRPLLDQYNALSKEKQDMAVKGLKEKKLGRFVVIMINPKLLGAENNLKLQTTLYHETSHADDYLLAVLADNQRGGPLKAVTKAESERTAYNQGNEFIWKYLKLNPSSPAGMAAGGVVDVESYITDPKVLENPNSVIKDEVK